MLAGVRAHFIFYVEDQERSTAFYARVLDQPPTVNVPGMSEFVLNAGAVLGLMPVAGIVRLLGPSLGDPQHAAGVPRAELYLVVPDAGAYHERALRAGAREVSSLRHRDWGHVAAYSLDRDGHVLAFAHEWGTDVRS